MKYKKFSKKAIVLSSILLVITLCGTIFLNASSGTDNNETLEYQSGINHSDVDIATRANEIDLEAGLLKFDHIDGSSVALSSDNEISSANILLITNGVIRASEIDNIVLFVSESIDRLDKGNICIKDQDGKTIYPKESI